MKITIKTAGITLEQLPRNEDGRYELELSERDSVEDLLRRLLPPDTGISYMVNGNHVPKDTKLEENDELLIMRMMYGG